MASSNPTEKGGGDLGSVEEPSSSLMQEVSIHELSPSPSVLDGSSGLFFADATLDLSEAHDMAETPEPQRDLATSKPMAPRLMEMPNLDSPNTKTSGMNTTNASLEQETPPRTDASMNRITSADIATPPRRHSARTTPSHRPRIPRRPRDIPWAVSWVLFVPTSLLWTTLFTNDYSFYTRSAQFAAFNCVLLAYGATFVLGRILYRTMGGGDGDDGRHFASHVMLVLAPVSVAIYLLMALVIFTKTPNAMGYAILPLLFLVRHLWALRKWQQQQAFFQVLMKMALDILSRSLRRSSFYRIIASIMVVQLCMVVWWKLAVFSSVGTPWVWFALVAGKWATGTVARILGLVASGGIANWFIQQQEVIMTEQQQQQTDTVPTPESDDSADYNVAYRSTLPEEYRSADASAYQSVLGEMDEGMDDDYDDEDESGHTSLEWTNPGSSTVKALLIAALTTSFGSVAQCGLLGWLAQFTWTIVRNADAMSASISQRGGFRGMQIGQNGQGVVMKIVNRASVMARQFVRTHSDLAISHVAAYYKSYQRAASDVMALVDASGVEPIIHDDITTHMCASVCGSVSGLIVIVVGILLAHNRSDQLSDQALVQSMVIAFVCCYTLVFTVLEPLRASIKAIYVCFAEHPQSLSQAFPLIFHRLSRVSEANLV